ncbi:prolyl 4-hydroxylase subunit alpha-1 [Cochliomyia hominivorax]
MLQTTTTIILIILFTLNNISPSQCFDNEIFNSQDSWSLLYGEEEQNDLNEMLKTEEAIIDTLRNYIETQENKLNILKKQIFEIRSIHDGVTDREKYLYNPLNAVKILKRFTADWRNIKSYAENILKAEDFTKNYTQQSENLIFPTDEDYDAALLNLLRIQDMYQLEPQRLAVGEVNGVKLGSEMTWSDCLEIGLMSSKNGFPTNAKYWMETALEKLTNIDDFTKNNNKESKKSVKNKLNVMEALLKTEYELGNFKEALKVSKSILKLRPQHKEVIQIEKQIKRKLRNEKKLKKTDMKQKNKTTKSVEELMIGEICREASSLQNNKQIHTATWNPSTSHTPSCILTTNNLPFLLLQPLKVEMLSLDPFIVIYHQILSDSRVKELKDFIVQGQDDTFEFTKIGEKKMREINGKLHYVIGHYGQELYNQWQVEHYNFESIMDFEMMTLEDLKKQTQAKLLFNLQQSLMGGSVIFPQLELAVSLPKGSLLYWSTLNEFHAYDYRIKHHVCPVIGGSQITAITSIKNI